MRNYMVRKNKKLVINRKEALASRNEHDLGSREDTQRRESARENQESVAAEKQRDVAAKSDDACRLPRKQQVKCDLIGKDVCVDEDEALDEHTSVWREGRDEMIREGDVGTGLSGALDLRRKQEAFKEMEGECSSWNMVERKRKRKNLGIEDEKFRDEFKDIQIERVDEWGRKLTVKEAFRSLSYGFHGKGPGKKKLERRKKQEAKLKQMQTSERDMETVERMRGVHAKLKSPYIVL